MGSVHAAGSRLGVPPVRIPVGVCVGEAHLGGEAEQEEVPVGRQELGSPAPPVVVARTARPLHVEAGEGGRGRGVSGEATL